jgi:DNA-directed RNA polymerase specialized sigma24 family protein
MTKWPPKNGRDFIRSELFGDILISLVSRMQQRYPKKDFSDAVAVVYEWFDKKLSSNYRFINKTRFPTQKTFQLYVQQAILNAARRTDQKRQRHQKKALPEGFAIIDPSPSPVSLAQLHEAMANLPEPHKMVFERILEEGMASMELLAAILDKTIDDIERLYEEAIDMLV